MISRYCDHAANERTYLAWVQTAIAVMAFGFLVVEFDLFLEVAARSLADRPPSGLSQAEGDGAGLLLIVLGGAMIVVATLRFRPVATSARAKLARPGGISWTWPSSGCCWP